MLPPHTFYISHNVQFLPPQITFTHLLHTAVCYLDHNTCRLPSSPNSYNPNLPSPTFPTYTSPLSYLSDLPLVLIFTFPHTNLSDLPHSNLSPPTHISRISHFHSVTSNTLISRFPTLSLLTHNHFAFSYYYLLHFQFTYPSSLSIPYPRPIFTEYHGRVNFMPSCTEVPASSVGQDTGYHFSRFSTILIELARSLPTYGTSDLLTAMSLHIFTDQSSIQCRVM